DRAADGLGQRVGGVVRLDRVPAEVVRAGELLLERGHRVLGGRRLRGVGAGARGVDVQVVVAGVVEALRGLDAVAAEVGDVEADRLHLRAGHAGRLVVGAADVQPGGAEGLDAVKDGAEVGRGGGVVVLRR